MNNKCYIVLGPESSGNHLMTQILAKAGVWVIQETKRPLENQIPSAVEQAVCRRSYPYGNKGEGRHWPQLPLLSEQLRAHGFDDLFVIVMIRDQFCTANSQVKTGRVNSFTEALRNIAIAHKKIFSQISVARLEHVCVTYEGLVTRPKETITWLQDTLQLVIRIDNTDWIYNANTPWLDKISM